MIEREEISGSPPGGIKPPPGEIRTGALRGDLELFPGTPDEFGRPGYVIFDPVAGSYFRIPESDYRIIRQLAVDQPLEQFLEQLRSTGVNASREEVVRVLLFLRQSGLTRISYGVSEQRVLEMRRRKRELFWQIVLSTYLFFRIPLISPDRFLVVTLEPMRLIFNRWTLLLIKILAAVGYLCLLVNFYKFATTFWNSLSLQGLLRYSLAVIFIKVIHEFAHAYVARNFGCRVRRMGIAMVFFVPRLYTDLTDSWRIPDRRKRFLMDGAGIWSELLIGGLAALIWANTAPGTVNSVAYYIFSVSIINTVLVNGNPFIRYDGYYMLMDLLGIDNLQRRSIDLVRNAWRRQLFGMDLPQDPARGWTRIALSCYAVAAFLYRIFLYLSIVLLVYFSFAKALGIVLLVLEVYLMIAKPIWDEGRFLVKNRKSMKRNRAFWSLAGAAVLILLLVLPLPWKLGAPCEIKPAQSHLVYAPQSGYLAALPPPDGSPVRAGESLFRLRDPQLDWEYQQDQVAVALRREALDQAQRDPALLGQVPLRTEQLRQSETEAAERSRRLQQLDYLSPLSGRWALLDRHLVVGRRLQRGELLGEVQRVEPVRAVAYVAEDEVKYIRVGDAVRVTLNRELGTTPGRVVRLTPMAATPEASPLLSVYGGPLQGVVDERGVFQPLAAYYELDIEFPGGAELPVGRTGTATLRKYSSVIGNLGRGVLQVLRRELSF